MNERTNERTHLNAFEQLSVHANDRRATPACFFVKGDFVSVVKALVVFELIRLCLVFVNPPEHMHAMFVCLVTAVKPLLPQRRLRNAVVCDEQECKMRHIECDSFCISVRVAEAREMNWRRCMCRWVNMQSTVLVRSD
jgi:hypothetical protein